MTRVTRRRLASTVASGMAILAATTFTVFAPLVVSAATMSGTLTPAAPSCTIAASASTCTVSLTWTTTNPVSTSAVMSSYPIANTTVFTGNSGTNSASVPHAGRSFFLYNNAVLLATSIATANCASGTTWNGSVCQAPTMSGTLTPLAPSCTIAAGASTCSVSLTWTTANPVSTSQVTSPYPYTGFVVGTGNNGSALASVPHSGANFFLYNNNVLLAQSSATANCASGTTWNGSVCQAPTMSGTLTPLAPSCTIAAAPAPAV